MAVNDPDDVLARAARELREEPQPGWDDLAGSLVAAVRSATRRSVPLRARPAADDEQGRADERAGHRVSVSDLVVVRLAARAVEAVPGVAPARVLLQVDGEECRGAQVHLVGRYGTDLDAASARVRQLVGGVLDDVLGPVPDGDPARVVDVVVDDVVPDATSL